MKVIVLKEAGEEIALLGLSLNKSQEGKDMSPVANKLAICDHGHNKFLRQISVWLDIDAPRYFWSEFDTYKVGTVTQSESTMHTITKRVLASDDFEGGICSDNLKSLNGYVKNGDWYELKKDLPESFLQRRIVSLNYQVLREIYVQRNSHRLPEWKFFCKVILDSMEHPEWLL